MANISKEEKKFLLDFGLHLRKFREDREWSLEYTEEKGIRAWQYLQRIETGKQNPSLLVLRKIVKTYDISLVDLFRKLKI